MNSYDAVVIGAGAAGGIVAALLSESGKRVLLLERGRNLAYAQVPRDHLRNHRLSLYGHNTGPCLDGNPRIYADGKGRVNLVRPHEAGYHNNAMCVGGGTRIYGGQAWRFMPEDFRMASIYGCPKGSSLADWPVKYEDLERFYDRAEWEIGVGGDAGSSPVPRSREYPLPPVPDNPQRLRLARAAKTLGWKTTPTPLLINTAPYHGRPACNQCQHCVGFACPSDSKNGTHNTMIPRALATGLCELVCEAIVENIETDSTGRVVGVSYLASEGANAKRIHARSKVVIAAGGAIESARLLLNSGSQFHPDGLGNHSDQVGRHLQGHYYAGAFALMPEAVFNGEGPGVSIATCHFNHGNPGIVGGSMIANEFLRLPIIFWRNALPSDLPKWGAENKRFMRENYTRVMQVQGPVQEIPSPDGRVKVDAKVKDRWGIPVARLSGTTHPETLKTAEFIREQCIKWLEAAGAERIWSEPVTLRLSGGQHQAGTCRMGNDPETSVVDQWGRVHGHDNLFVIDGSVHVTNGGFNPVLTIMALAFRSGEYIARNC